MGVRKLTQAALLAALYAALCYLQNFLLPGSGSFPVQLRVAEALCVLALYTPAAIPGLGIGCLIFNLALAAALPLDALVGPAATALAAGAMWLTRKVTLRGYPLPALCMPAVFNGLLVGWELTVSMGGSFWLNALYVSAGELAVLLTFGSALFYSLKARHLDRQLF